MSNRGRFYPPEESQSWSLRWAKSARLSLDAQILDQIAQHLRGLLSCWICCIFLSLCSWGADLTVHDKSIDEQARPAGITPPIFLFPYREVLSFKGRGGQGHLIIQLLSLSQHTDTFCGRRTSSLQWITKSPSLEMKKSNQVRKRPPRSPYPRKMVELQQCLWLRQPTALWYGNLTCVSCPS